MLIIGAVFENLPGEILRAYKHSWVSVIKALGLATILMRAGLKINYVKVLGALGGRCCMREAGGRCARVHCEEGAA